MAFKTAPEMSQHVQRLASRGRSEMRCPFCGGQGPSNFSDMSTSNVSLPIATGASEVEELLEVAAGAVPAVGPFIVKSCRECRACFLFRSDAGDTTWRSDSAIVQPQDGGKGWG